MHPDNPMKKNIKKIVYVMFENRSFDTMLGWLYKGDPQPTVNNIPSVSTVPFQGLTDKLLTTYAQPLKKPLEHWKNHNIVKGVQGNHYPANTPFADPEETFKNITYQIYQNEEAFGPPTMLGFLQNYYDHWGGLIDVEFEILDTYTFNQLPVLNTLAYDYGVSDEWFCSIPSQTSINRAFSICGNSVGYTTHYDKQHNIKTAMVNNHFWENHPIKHPVQPALFSEPTIWEVLYEQGFSSPEDWQIYYSAPYLHGYFGYTEAYTYYMFESLQNVLSEPSKSPGSPPDSTLKDTNYHQIDQFLTDAKAGTLPKFSYIEPRFTTGLTPIKPFYLAGDDYHPPSDVKKGECFLKQLYDAIVDSPHWDETLFIVAWDEAGGTLDHIAPPNNKHIINPHPDISSECDFQFNRLGIRVPMLFISPWVTKNSVIRSSDPTIPFDHTSWLATLLDWFDLEPSLLGARTAAAPKFDAIISDAKRSCSNVLENVKCDALVESEAEDKPLTVRKAAEVAHVMAAHGTVLDPLKLLHHSLANAKTEKQLADFYRSREE